MKGGNWCFFYLHVGGFLQLLALSRVGLWAFDLAERQIVQQSTEQRMLVFSMEHVVPFPIISLTTRSK